MRRNAVGSVERRKTTGGGAGAAEKQRARQGGGNDKKKEEHLATTQLANAKVWRCSFFEWESRGTDGAVD
jgi:hypothetical protein